ncbi:MAG: energy transducer TonB [Blastocatellia bacterium]|nr:energy transducer TonB [Blastocatellia bacterium]
MKQTITKAVVALFVVFLAGSLFGQTEREALPVVSAEYQVSSEYQKIRDLALLVGNFRSPNAASATFAGLADALWKRDEGFARELFGLSLQRLEHLPNDTPQERRIRRIAQLRTVSLIAKHDREWSREIVDRLSEKATDKARFDLEIASSLLETEPKRAAEIAGQAVRDEIIPGFLQFVKNLRTSDQGSADNLYHQVLVAYSGSQSVSPDQFALLGTYLFTSPDIDPNDMQMITMVRFGDVLLPDIRLLRPGTATRLVRQYVASLSGVSVRSAGQDRQIYRALTLAAMPHAQRHAPDLVPTLFAGLALDDGSQVSVADRDPYENLSKRKSLSLEEKIAEIAKQKDGTTRDQLFLDLASGLWRKNDFASARKVSENIERREIRSELEVAILFGEARKDLANPQGISEATLKAERLPASMARGMIWLGIANKSTDRDSRSYAVQAALNTARRLSQPAVPYLFLQGAAQLKEQGDVDYQNVFNEGIQSLNNQAKADKPVVEIKLSIESLTISFPLTLSNVTLEPGQAFSSIAKDETVKAFELFAAIADEELRGQAFLALIKPLLEREDAEKRRAQERVVRVGEDGIRRSISKLTMPAYPNESLKKRVKGVVVAEIQFNGEGDLTDVKVLESPDTKTGDAVVTAARSWKFVPSQFEGKPISVRGKITFYFEVDGKGRGLVRNPKQFDK